MRRVLILFAVAILSLTACSSNDTPPETSEPAVAEITQTATLAPTVSVPTATLTEVRPTATSTSTPRPATPTLVPTATPQIYVVKEDDTLLGIAVDFDITVEALEKANGISEADFLQIGQEVVIPASSEVPVPPVSEPAAAVVQASPSSEESPATATPTTPAQVNEETPTASATAQIDSANAVASAGSSPEPPPPPVPAYSGPPLPDVTHPSNINPLTGLPVNEPAKLRRRPLMVRIGNDVGARASQVGFNSADIVYEEITEWWVTRFTAIFLGETPDTVGPVRSARLINVKLVPQYQGALAHSGGSDPVRWEISQAPIANLDEFYSPAPYFYRPNQGWQTRLAIDAQAARDYMVAAGLEAPVVQQGFLFSDTIDRGEPGENIFIPYPRATSFTQWSYDPASGKYLRWIDGQPLVDVSSGQVAADNVIIYFAEHQETDIVEDANGATSIRIVVNGQGPAWFFRDGKLNRGLWATDGTRTPYFTYEDGTPFPLKPGNSWVEVVPTYFTIGLNSPDQASSRP
jgi:LysM repeat protein